MVCLLDRLRNWIEFLLIVLIYLVIFQYDWTNPFEVSNFPLLPVLYLDIYKIYKNIAVIFPNNKKWNDFSSINYRSTAYAWANHELCNEVKLLSNVLSTKYRHMCKSNDVASKLLRIRFVSPFIDILHLVYWP